MESAVDSIVYVHSEAICESQRVGEGTRIWAFAHVMDGAVVGRVCNIGDHAFIETGARIGNRVTIKNHVMVWDGVTIEDGAFIGPGAIFTNDRYPRSRGLVETGRRYGHKENWLVPTKVGRGASIGAGAIILCGVSVGSYASVGAGAVVTRDVAPHRIVVGNPARARGWACVCGAPLGQPLCCPHCDRRYALTGGKLVAAE
jgi:acetyltransferase-like isoleucine patch superfamily enzyme